MTESEYIRATNRVKVTVALTIMRDVLPGENNGISDKERSEIIKKLALAEDRLFSLIDINE